MNASGGALLVPSGRALSALYFRAGERRSSRLADLVGRQALDVDALAARVLALPPGRIEETPYVGVEVESGPPEQVALARLPETPSEAARALRATLERVLDRLLVGTGRVAVLTGGGVDSSALLALTARRMRRVGGTVFGVALDFGGPGDDRPFREQLEAHVGCEILRVRPAEAAHRANLLLRGVDAAPMTSPGGAMEVELLARARAHGADVALMGVGADELLDGDPHSLADVSFPRAISDARRLRGFSSPWAPAISWVLRPRLARALPLRARRWRARRFPIVAPSWARPRLRQALTGYVSRSIEQTLSAPRSVDGRFERFRDSAQHIYLRWLHHQEEVASGLRRCDPYLDPELARFVTSLPPSWLLHGGMRRGLFRGAMSGVLPEAILRRESKAAFEPAFAAFVEAAGGFRSLSSLAEVKQLSRLDLVEPREFRRAFELFASSPETGWEDVWPALAVEAFLAERAL